MTRFMMHHVLVVLLSCCLVAADLAHAVANAEDAAASAGFAADADKSNTLLNNLRTFVDTNDQFDDVLENNFKSYSFNENDLCSKGNRILTPDDLLDAVVDDNLTNEKTGNQLTFTNVDGNDYPPYVTESFVDFLDVNVDQHKADEYFSNESKSKTSTQPTKIIHRQHVTHQKQDTEESLMTKGNSPSHDNHTNHHDASREGSSNQRQRSLLSCVSSASGLARAVKLVSTTKSSSTTIKVCTSRIPMGSLNRRRRSRRRLQSSSFNGTNVTLMGLAGGIDFSNRSITFKCLLKRRCILDGQGISRIFYGTNAIITIDGFQFFNASSQNGDALGSGSALTLIGSSQVIIRDSSFAYNTAPSVGGAIMINNSTLTLSNSRRKIQFLKNEATYGGAIFGLYATIQTDVTTSSSSGIITFQDNYAIRDGGAVYVMNSTVVWNQITFEKNDASNGGAAMFIDTNVTMNNMYVLGNEANTTGGAFVFLHANVVINNSTFDSNNGNGTVEAIIFKSSVGQVTDSTFRRSNWYIGSSTLNLSNSCLPQGSNCVLGSTCNDCCRPYISWSTQVGYYCGPNPHNVKKCFGSDGTELKSAVANYASGDATIIANLTSIYGNISDWCTSSVSDWSYIFANLSSFNKNISNWDTSNATTMAYMFNEAYSFNQDISRWNTSEVTDMRGMFSYAKSFNQDISKWDTSKVVYMSNMFYQTSRFFNQNISNWDTSKVTDMSYMFWNAVSFNQDISKWNTSKVTDMSNLFYQAVSFNQDISKWDTSTVTDMTNMFSWTNFKQDISKWDTSKVTSMSGMFLRASLFNQSISNWDTSKVMGMSGMFLRATSFNQNISRWDTSNVTDMSSMFFAASFNQDISQWDTSKVQIMDSMFANNKNFNGNITRWIVSQVTNMDGMFAGATSFNQDISGWDISKVSSMTSMMLRASVFKKNLCAWKTKCQSIVFTQVFLYTNCPNQSDPICGTGPFCYTCP